MAIDFEWDEHNLFHIAQHGITPLEVEEAMTIGPIYLQTMIRSDEERILHAGRTKAGRILSVVITMRRQRVRIVTAFPAGKRIRAEYVAKRGETS